MREMKKTHPILTNPSSYLAGSQAGFASVHFGHRSRVKGQRKSGEAHSAENIRWEGGRWHHEQCDVMGWKGTAAVFDRNVFKIVSLSQIRVGDLFTITGRMNRALSLAGRK